MLSRASDAICSAQDGMPDNKQRHQPHAANPRPAGVACIKVKHPAFPCHGFTPTYVAKLPCSYCWDGDLSTRTTFVRLSKQPCMHFRDTGTRWQDARPCKRSSVPFVWGSDSGMSGSPAPVIGAKLTTAQLEKLRKVCTAAVG